MQFLLDHLAAQPSKGQSSFRTLTALQRAYDCQCSRAVFFRNSQCLSCHTPLGYEPELGRIFSLQAGSSPHTWVLLGPDLPPHHTTVYKQCANLKTAAACNWLLKADDHNPYCTACRLNRTIPDLSFQENAVLWGRLEDAKRRVISALISMELPVVSKVSEDREQGLAFDFLVSPPHGPRVITGHNNGLITINLEEADDVKREQIRASMHEPYRTLVGHFRHEVGHYYWSRLVAKTKWISRFRELFGNEQLDYALALKANYEHGPRPHWPDHFVSAYASVHPWEDWAETWAHYMHMVDTLGTALSFGLKPEQIAIPFDPFDADALYHRDGDGERFLSFLNSWMKLTAAMNELCRSMGQPDFYPFSLPTSAVTKLHFVHMLICENSVNCQLRKTAAA